ncbi:organic solute transporter Ostalpha-domain-containing protein [Collybia nuda]|uniref:Organic solute transporter Ostalpha-domain-containing protein n=1 Tax=Collybia nuda TaxID=64659 RepID=A0A9P5XSV5_9AGAR|nr:organic solute transporter Ostalpha-domain-containing protein [Collybia nuda]
MATQYGSGAGSRLPTAVLVVSGVSTVVAVLVSAMSIYLQLKNYRKPILQRMVIRIMIMVPIYAISSLISLFSLEAAFVIDAIRDIYEAFVIYCFFVLLLSYLGGERSLLILLYGRPPKDPVFPVSLFKREIDVSDPYTFLFLKRGILQYVQVKPILAAATLILKACGKFNEGDFRANSGYLYVSIVYNTSICLSLYCLAMFWLFVNEDLKPFRPVPKFLCVKGILFFSFWQAIGISILVAAGVITKLGPYTDPEHISVGLTDTLICIEMPLFAFAHMFAFSHTDYIDPHRCYIARMPMYYAFRDAFGLLDVIEDTKATLRGEGMDYREFEPAEGIMHQGDGRDRRIRAGLRYSKGGQRKYWLPQPTKDTLPPGRIERGVNRAINKATGRDQSEEVHAPLFTAEADEVVHLAPDLRDPDEDPDMWDISHTDDGYELPFGDPDEDDDELFMHSKKYLFGDYNYPCIDVSSEYARTIMWDEEERVLRDERGAWFSPIRGAKGRAALDRRGGPAWQGYGAVGTTIPSGQRGRSIVPEEETGSNNGNTIDYEQDRIPSTKSADVRMHWTKIKDQRGSPSISHSQSPHIRQRPGLQINSSSSPSSAESSSNAANRLRSSPLISRSSSGAIGSPVLPPDAVDLVVEDEEAAQEEHTRERRKGEPAVRGSGLRKVYRRGFIGQAKDGRHAHGEVEVQEPDGEGRVEAGQEIMSTLGAESGDSDNDGRHGELEPENMAEGIVARAETPPLHARVVVQDFDDDENPWA